jgi:hypothetical protein
VKPDPRTTTCERQRENEDREDGLSSAPGGTGPDTRSPIVPPEQTKS